MRLCIWRIIDTINGGNEHSAEDGRLVVVCSLAQPPQARGRNNKSVPVRVGTCERSLGKC